MKYVEDRVRKHTQELVDHAWSQIQKKHPKLVITDESRASLNLTLDTSQGVIFSSNPSQAPFTSREKRNAVRTALTPLTQDERNVGVFISEDGWLLIGCFKLGELVLFPMLEWSLPLPNEQLCRSFTFFLLDRFLKACEKQLSAVSQVPPKVAEDHIQVKRDYREQGILSKVAGLSNSIDCVAVIDRDGFVLGTAGDGSVAEDTAGGLAQFAAGAKKHLSKLGAASISRMSFSGLETTVYMVPLLSGSLTLAVSAHGPAAAAWARLAFEMALIAVKTLGQETHSFWSTPLEHETPPKRYRDSWFGHPKLVAKANFAALTNAEIFHLHSCRLLARAKAQNLRWFGGRGDAMRAGLRPCRACRP